MHSRYPELPALGISAAILVLIPLPRQIRARNIASIAIIFWFFEHCLVSGINAIVWAGNVNDSAPSWCDLSEAFCNSFNHHALTEISDQRHILEMEQTSHSPLRRSVSANISNMFHLDDLLLLAIVSGVECTLRGLCALCCLAYGCFCVSRTALPYIQVLVILLSSLLLSLCTLLYRPGFWMLRQLLVIIRLDHYPFRSAVGTGSSNSRLWK